MDIRTYDFAGFTIRTTAVSEMANNVCLITPATAGGGAAQHILVDAADDFPAIRELIASAGGGETVAILTTHRHWDHVRALAEAQRELTEHTIAGVDDAEAIAEESGATVEQTVAHGDVLELAGLRLDCIALRGHTPGSIAYALTDSEGAQVILSGDSLFPGGPGKTWSSDDFDSLMADLQARVFDVYGDDVLIIPGHGDSTTLGAERPQIPAWLERGW